MKKYLLPADGNLYKANLHCHSTYSDGRYTVEHLKEIYKAQGYNILAYSDHNTLIPHPELKDETFLPLTATEIDVSNPYGKTYHLNFFSRDEMKTEFPPIERVYGADGVNKIIEIANADGFLCQYNHPRWSFQDYRDFGGLKNYWGFEIYNTGCEKEMINGWGDYEYELVTRESGVYPTTSATDDNHNVFKDENSPHSDAFGGWTMIKAKSLDYGEVYAAMERKDCYGTTGPIIYDMYAEDGKLYLKTSPVCCACVRFETRRTHILRSHDNDMTQHILDISGDFRYIRVELTDTMGRKAMSRAYTYDEING